MKKTVAIILILFMLITNTSIVFAISEAVDNNSNKQIMTVSNNINGTYRIAISTPEYCHMSLEVESASKYSGANVRISEWFNINNNKNKFEIKPAGNGYYTIGLANSNNVLDVCNGDAKPRTNVWQYEKNNTNAQMWKLVENSDGSYSFASKLKEDLYLTVTNGNMSEGANVEINTKTNNVGQKFKLINLNDKPNRIFENGTYKINLNSDSNLALELENSSTENGGNVRVGKWLNDTSNMHKKFELIYEEDGYYTIKSVNSGKVLEIQGGKMTSGTNVSQYNGNYTDSQRWKIVKNTDGSYSIINKKSGLYLDINGNLAQNSNVQVNSKIDSNRQKFKITKVTDEGQLIKNGTYRISINELEHRHMSLEVKNGSNYSGENVQIGEWFNINNNKHKFKITYTGNGYYTIGLLNTNNVLDVQNGSKNAGTNIWQYESNNSDAQKWRIVVNDDGSCSFISKLNNLYLTVQGANLSEGANIEVNNRTTKLGQNFKLINLEDKPKRELNDGIYKINIPTNRQMVVGITGNLSDNGAVAKIANWAEVENGDKKYNIKYNQDDGYYTIQNIYSGKVLEVQNGGMKNNTVIWQYEENYTDSQRWKIVKNTDGTYSLQNKKSDLYLSVESTNVKAGNNIVLYEKNSSKVQNFGITPVDKLEGAEIVEGTYKIVSASNTNVSIDIDNASRLGGANVQLGNTSNTIRNEFNIIPDGNGYYIIRSVNSGNVVDVENAGMASGTNIWQYEENGTDAQKWMFKLNSDGTYSIISKKNGLYMDICDGKIASGTNIWMYGGNGSAAQKFKLIKQEKKTEKYIEEGLYKLEAKPNRNFAIDIDGALSNDGVTVQIWTYKGEKQQQFHLYYENNGYYYIENLNSGKVVEVVGQGLKQYPKNLNKEAQKWILKKQNDGSYVFVAKESGLAITIPNNNISDGTDLKMQAINNSNYQKFFIERAGIYVDESKYPGIRDRLDAIKVKHPNWNFELLYTGLDFNTVTYEEYQNKQRNLVDSRSYSGGWISSTAWWSGVWASPSRVGVNYFMDTRNFLNEIDVFQFLDVNSYVENSVSLAGIQDQVNGSFLQNYANDVNNACKNQNVNPYFVLARLFQEQGRKGSSIGTGMPGGDGKTYYNPYNIGAQVGNDYATALAKAKEERMGHNGKSPYWWNKLLKKELVI